MEFRLVIRIGRCGGFLRNECGRWLCGFVHNVDFSISVAAELWAVRSGQGLSWLGIRFRSIVPLLSSSQHDDISWNGSLLRDIRQLLLRHTYLKGNAGADWLLFIGCMIALRD
ncbi:hypothetical protein CRG98_013027 [Punica granatum]|uniref:RNase H type-1 domain-containing protein n=1 Tax=Punica granatum TaxID=22663 RepID=A0A2I0KEG6_PUNGR|nr:hypothetical protein CRG98_013027 [Punica granatum]